MSQAKSEKPTVTTYGDYEVISPPNQLLTGVLSLSADPADDPVARAEQALAGLSSEFSISMIRNASGSIDAAAR